MADPVLSVPLRFVAEETPVRRGEPVTVGLPWPRGVVRTARQFRLIGPEGSPQVLQTEVLDCWPDGSVRWCLFDFLATGDGRVDGYRVEVLTEPSPPPPADLPTERHGDTLFVETGVARFAVNTPHDHLIRAVIGSGPDAVRASGYFSHPIRDVGPQGQRNLDVGFAEVGPVRARVTFRYDVTRRGVAPDGSEDTTVVNVFGHFDLFRGSAVVRAAMTVRNPHPAAHPGGNWDLGGGGSIDLDHLAVHLGIAWPEGRPRVVYSPERGAPFAQAAGVVAVAQHGSGGENWQSANHLDRHRRVPVPRRGYVLTADGRATDGLRATPVVGVERDGRFLGVAVPQFWENFPKAVEADASRITLHLLPEGVEHELQGGEQKTHTFYLAFGPDAVTDEPMVWCRSPLLCRADPEWYASAGAVPYLTPKAVDPNAAYLALVDQAVEGPDTFARKREIIDEYGWRHFGDVYADHEATRHAGPTPLVSHYNNQYDVVGGLAVQFLRSGDPRWWAQMVACADHTCDVDVYHTDGDKPAYNRGLFWHTYHYADADTGTHRAYPKSLRRGPQDSLHQKMDQLGDTAAKLKQSYAVGGGPSASHNYNAGLMLAYFLTGNPLYRDTAVDLARYVVTLDDPSGTPFRWLSREHTGYATESGGGGYHGPGRASANSVLALLVGHQLTGDRGLLDKAEQLIRRVSHPRQDLDALDLLNAELRWYYTMHLQAIGRYLDYKIELGELDRMYAYARLTLLHYARWMAASERPILDTPERLQYPTETWAAQDMRKAEVFQFAAKHAAGTERERFLERAEWFFRYVERTLTASPTKSLCRPVVLMMNFGWSRAWWQEHPDASAPEPSVPATADEFGEWRMFVSQKAIAIRRAKVLAAAGVAAGLAAVAGLAAYVLG